MTSRLEVDRTQEVTRPRPELDIVSMFSQREPERYVRRDRPEPGGRIKPVRHRDPDHPAFPVLHLVGRPDY